ncbi:hypothetical protein NQ317_017299 [Molorchus minor]|uniref:Uncharacterized protein n=1 Tax=Molorchus minor TaxID=1323400 RepID=A0ABQ9JTR4_9CUCU|nr:hypothetical protein NQ317_017299 [Molorchus minor]
MNLVSNLLKCNFPGLSLEDKIKIKELCRTLPDLKLTLRQNLWILRHYHGFRKGKIEYSSPRSRSPTAVNRPI